MIKLIPVLALIIVACGRPADDITHAPEDTPKAEVAPQGTGDKPMQLYKLEMQLDTTEMYMFEHLTMEACLRITKAYGKSVKEVYITAMGISEQQQHE